MNRQIGLKHRRGGRRAQTGRPAASGVFVREDHLLERVNAFLSDHYRRQLLDAALAQEREQQVTGLRRAVPAPAGDTEM